MGLIILHKTFKGFKEAKGKIGFLVPLGGVGGFFDAIGGGGWGPIVTSTLVAGGSTPRFVIGSVNLAEFFVTIVEAFTFLVFLRVGYWRIIVGLIIGGVLAAPLGAYVCKKIAPRLLMGLVGIFLIILNLRTLYLAIM